MKKFVILIEDDFELFGNGLGNVADLQYLPALAFMNILDRHNIKISFMVDAAQQLFFSSRRATNRLISIQYELWEDTVKTALERGHDVQLHIHPQWLGARMDGDYCILSNRWNIGQYAPAQQRDLVEGCISYLHGLLRPIRPTYQVIGYKAGAWGMQPSEYLMELLAANGIYIIMGARDEMYIPGNDVDFRNMEEPALPYIPNKTNLVRIADHPNELIMLPMHGYAPSLIEFARLGASKYSSMSRALKRERAFYLRGPIPEEVTNASPFVGRHVLKFSLHPYLTHLAIGDMPFKYLKNSFATVIARLRKLDWPRIPIVIESHTKQFPGHYSDIERFLEYVTKNYSEEVEFGTVSSIGSELKSTPGLVRSRKSSIRYQA